jgi:hypothetical protein
MAICLIGTQIWKREKGWRIASGVVLVGVLLYSMPVMARQAYRTLYSPGMEMQIREEFLKSREDPNLLFIDNDSVFWILHKLPASPIEAAKIKKEGLAYHLKNHSFSNIYVFQSVLVNDQTGALSIDPVDDLGPDFELEPVFEKKVQTLLFARISRVTAIKTDGQTVATAVRTITPVQERRTPEELDRARALYLEHWVKQLP